MHIGDYAEDYPRLNKKFTTRTTAGVPSTLGGSPVITVYKKNNTTPVKTSAEAYITLTADFNSKTGLNNVLIDLSGDAFFEPGEDYEVVLTTGTVNSVNVAGEVLFSFSIENRSIETVADDVVVMQSDIDILTGTDGAILNTTQSNYAPAKAGDNMGLSDDAITAGKFDESSAFPIVAVDTGATMLARTGADSDTLETLADFIAIAQSDLDLLTGTDGATLATLQGNYAPAKVGALMGLADGAITAAKIAAAAFIAAKFGADFLTAAKIADNAIGADQLASSAVQKIAITIIPKKNTAFTFDFPMVDDTTHNLQAGFSVSGVVIIDGASTVALDGSIAEVSDGIYRCSGSAVDMNGDDIAFLFTATGADPSPVFIFKTAA